MKKHRSIRENALDKIKKHIADNFNLYIIVGIFFVIGIIAGVFFYNSLDKSKQEPSFNYINSFIQEIKEGSKVDKIELLKQTLISDFIYTIIIWFAGCTIIGLPIVYGIVSIKGFSLSYTICCIIGIFGIPKGIIFCILSLFLQNALAIPAYLGLGVSGNKLYNLILKDKGKNNIKLQIIRHTLFCTLMLGILILSSIIETYISSILTEIYISTI